MARICDECKGAGEMAKVCRQCNGKGKTYHKDGFGECWTEKCCGCGGSGERAIVCQRCKCDKCEGTGHVWGIEIANSSQYNDHVIKEQSWIRHCNKCKGTGKITEEQIKKEGA